MNRTVGGTKQRLGRAITHRWVVMIKQKTPPLRTHLQLRNLLSAYLPANGPGLLFAIVPRICSLVLSRFIFPVLWSSHVDGDRWIDGMDGWEVGTYIGTKERRKVAGGRSIIRI